MDPVLHASFRLALTLLFGVAALHKLREPGSFAATVRSYRLLPEAATGVAARTLPAAEALVAILLFATRSGAWLRGAAAMAAGLLVVYSLAIAANLARGRRGIDCGCLGPASRQPLSGGLLVRNGLLLAAALALWIPPTVRPLGALDAFAIAGAVASSALLFHGANQLLAADARLREADAARMHS